MAVPKEPLECGYLCCTHSYNDKKDLIKHKYANHEFYCKRCDYDAVDWDDSLAHKVNAMVPGLVGDDRHKRAKTFKHIVCEFCGEEFKSLGGRDIHKTRLHQADQQIKCMGSAKIWNPKAGDYVTELCPMVFGRASQYIRHITEGRCMFIKSSELEGERQQKQIIKEVLKNPDIFALGLRGKKMYQSSNPKDCRYSDDEGDDYNTFNGGSGIKLGPMDEDDSSQARDFSTLCPEKKYVDLAVPKAPGDGDAQLSPVYGLRSGLDSLSLGGPSSLKHKGQSGLSTPLETIFGDHHTNASSNSTMVDNTTRGTASADSDQNDCAPSSSSSSKTLAKEADWGAIQASLERSRLEDRHTNILYSRFWDPYSKDWAPDMFMNHLTGRLTCPFQDCGAGYTSKHDIATHLRSRHIEQQKQCKTCYRIFQNLPDLIQHFESSSRGGKCTVARAGNYQKALDEATGGFLTATKVQEEKIWGLQLSQSAVRGQDAAVTWERPDGIRSYDYHAQVPARVASSKQ